MKALIIIRHWVILFSLSFKGPSWMNKIETDRKKKSTNVITRCFSENKSQKLLKQVHQAALNRMRVAFQLKMCLNCRIFCASSSPPPPSSSSSHKRLYTCEHVIRCGDDRRKSLRVCISSAFHSFYIFFLLREREKKKWKFIKRHCTQSRLENWLAVVLYVQFTVVSNMQSLDMPHSAYKYVPLCDAPSIKIFVHWYAIPFSLTTFATLVSSLCFFFLSSSFLFSNCQSSTLDRINDISSLILVIFI